MAAQWAWHCYDMATNTSLGTVPMSSWYHEDRLKDPGEWNAELAPVETVADERFVLAATTPAKCAVLARRTDEAGIVRIEYTGWIPPGGRRRPSLNGAGLLAYLDRRLLSDLSYTLQDQAAILAGIITNAAGARIDVSGITLTGKQRTASWTQSNGKFAGEALRDIAGRLDGLDFDIRTELDGGVPTRRLRTWYPRRGADSIPVFTYGGNMLSAPAEEGNADFATEALVLGVETNPTNHDRYRILRRNTYLVDGLGYPLIDVLIDRDDVTTTSTVSDLADGTLRDAAVQTDGELSFQVNPDDGTWPWGSWDLGADCMVDVPAATCPWWPDGIDEKRRVVAHRWTVNAEGGEVLNVVTGRPWTATL